ncbi:MAG: enoyl-CoA hydratase/isomerase family protein [Gammaproteobacteria bacterium]|nr:enoyl-CoA hydratase/isomerase family protein [Gammaproteobacteria bacterium]
MTIQLAIDGAIATINLSNPAKHNSLTADAVSLFIQHLDTLRTDPAVRVLIVTNREGKTFCAGASLQQMLDGSMSGELFSTLTNSLATLPIPTIAMLNGNAYGGGAELALCCDFRFGTPGMCLFVPPARIGLCYPLDGIKRLVRNLGNTFAKRLLIAGEEFNGQQLYELGYLTHLLAPEDLESATSDFAQTIAGLAPLAVQAMKQLCDQITHHQLDPEAAAELIANCNASRDLQEGLQAVNEKRTPVFRGK